MKYMFFGGPDIAARAFRACVGAFGCPVAVVTTPPKARGRSSVPTPSETHRAASELCPNTVVHTPGKITKADIAAWSNYAPDVLIVVAYPRILGPKTRGIARLGAVNFHPSLLPSYRGPDPIRGPLFDNKNETGVTAMLLDDGVDTGPVIDRIRIPIEPDDNYETVYERICSEGIPFFTNAVQSYVDGTAQPSAQSGTASHTSKVVSETEYLNPNVQTTAELFGRIRALSPVPGAKCEIKNMSVKIISARMVENIEKSGTGVHMMKDALHIVGSDAGVRIIEVDTIIPAGKKAMSASDWIKGLR